MLIDVPNYIPLLCQDSNILIIKWIKYLYTTTRVPNVKYLYSNCQNILHRPAYMMCKS